MTTTATFLRVRPAHKIVAPVMVRNVGPETMKRIVKCRDPYVSVLGEWEDYPICAVGPRAPVTESATMPRFRLLDFDVIPGDVWLFGMNMSRAAASCPIPTAVVLENIEWLPPLNDLGKAIA